MTGKLPILTPGQLDSLSKFLGDTDNGLTGDTIGRVLRDAKIRDIAPAATKWKRLHAAICASSSQDANSTRAYNFIRHALDPARYVGRHALFEERRTGVNTNLVLSGVDFREDAKFGSVNAATTLKEAEVRRWHLQYYDGGAPRRSSPSGIPLRSLLTEALCIAWEKCRKMAANGVQTWN